MEVIALSVSVDISFFVGVLHISNTNTIFLDNPKNSKTPDGLAGMLNTAIRPHIGEVRGRMGTGEGGFKVQFPEIPFSNGKQIARISSGIQILDILKGLKGIDMELVKFLAQIKKPKDTGPRLTIKPPQILPWVAVGKGGYAMLDRSG